MKKKLKLMILLSLHMI